MDAKAFFALQIHFARAVARLAALPLAPTLLDYTNLYVRFGLGRDFDAANPVWQAYLAELRDTPDLLDRTVRFYATRPRVVDPPGLVAAFGCFSYGRLADDRVRLHFHNGETGGRSPLALDSRDRRVAELAAPFAHVRASARRPVRVVGASWLYNLEAYRRLFPPSYLATARPLRGRFRSMPLWGQFLNRDGELREDAAREFRTRLARQSDADALDACFPLQVFSLEAPAEAFYACYGI